MASELDKLFFAPELLDNGVKPSTDVEQDFDHPLSNGLVGRWLLNEGAGDTAFDISGNGNDGALSGATWDSATRGQSLIFDADGETVNCGVISEVLGASALTMHCKLLFTNTNPYDWRGIIGTYSSSTARSVISLSSNSFAGQNGIHLFAGNGSNAHGYPSTGEQLVAGNVYDIHYVFNGGGSTNADRLKLYINGLEKSLTFSGTIPSSLHSTSVPFRIGDVELYRAGGYEMIECGVVALALTADEIWENYTNPYGDLIPRGYFLPAIAPAAAGEPMPAFTPQTQFAIRTRNI